MIEFSIIIPVYNGEKTIVRCLESIQNQTFDYFEAIIVDDGSTDKTGELCASFVNEDDRFVYRRQSNRGPSAARNFGMELAGGKFIAFVDSDDYVAENYLEEIRKGFGTDSDAVFFGYKKICDGKEIACFLPPSGDFIQRSEMLIALSDADMFGYTCVKAWRRKAMGSCRFPEDMRLFEDEVFTCEALSECSGAAIVSMALYYYDVSWESTLSHRVYENFCQLQNRVFTAWCQLLDGCENKEKYLSEKACGMINKSRYYLFEHKIRIRPFCAALRTTEFYRTFHGADSFCRSIDNRRDILIFFQRMAYRWKMRIIGVLHELKKSDNHSKN